MNKEVKKVHRLWLLPLAMILALVTVQCSPKAQPQPTLQPGSNPVSTATSQAVPTVNPTDITQANTAKSIFVHTSPDSFPDLDPTRSYSSESYVLANCYETLTFYNAPGSSEQISGKLATSWESNADATEWTFHLRHGVKFQDGEPFNAAAVKYSIMTTKDGGVGAAYMWGPVSSIETPDDYTVVFKLSYSAPLDIIASADYAAWIFSPKFYTGHSTDWANEGHCDGTGPYTIESYERGSRLIMTRFDDYWGGWKPGQFEKIVFEITGDAVTRQQEIEAGQADFTFRIPSDNLPELMNDPKVTVYQGPSFNIALAMFNTQKAPLDNVLIREAVAYTFPMDVFLKNVMAGRAKQSYGPVPAGVWGHSETIPQFHYDLDKAKQLLTQAGYPNGGFKLLYIIVTGDLDGQNLGELWKAELAKVGIDLEIQALDWNANWDMCKSGPANAQDIYLMHWWPDYISPISFLYGMFHSENPPMFNCSYWYNTDFDKLIDDANTFSGYDRQKATDMFIQAQKMIFDNAAAYPLYDEQNVHIMASDIKGYIDNPAYANVVFVYDLTR
jgi:peptide/nickel transport system substrate-binding protein